MRTINDTDGVKQETDAEAIQRKLREARWRHQDYIREASRMPCYLIESGNGFKRVSPGGRMMINLQNKY